MAAPASIPLPLLDRVRVASPCNARWEDMRGDGRVRRCDRCSLSVYNLSALGRAEAEALLERHFNADGTQKAGRFCAQLYRRADGTVLTADCPVGLAALRAAARRATIRVAAAVGLTSLVTLLAAAESRHNRFAACQPIGTVANWLRAAPRAAPLGAMRGKVAVAGGISAPLPVQQTASSGVSLPERP